GKEIDDIREALGRRPGEFLVLALLGDVPPDRLILDEPPIIVVDSLVDPQLPADTTTAQDDLVDDPPDRLLAGERREVIPYRSPIVGRQIGDESLTDDLLALETEIPTVCFVDEGMDAFGRKSRDHLRLALDDRPIPLFVLAER